MKREEGEVWESVSGGGEGGGEGQGRGVGEGGGDGRERDRGFMGPKTPEIQIGF